MGRGKGKKPILVKTNNGLAILKKITIDMKQL